jgi:nitroreductase
VPGRDFAHAGTLPVGAGHDRAAAYAVLYGPGDEPADWLRAGEALSAGWLAATERGMAVLPYSAVVELPAIRAALRRVLASVGYPYLVLRLGTAAQAPPHTRRLPVSQTVEVTGG